jgi:hypothetical protein
MKFKSVEDAIRWYVETSLRYGDGGCGGTMYDEHSQALGQKIFIQGKITDFGNDMNALVDIDLGIMMFNERTRAALYVMGLLGYCHAVRCVNSRSFAPKHVPFYVKKHQKDEENGIPAPEVTGCMRYRLDKVLFALERYLANRDYILGMKPKIFIRKK